MTDGKETIDTARVSDATSLVRDGLEVLFGGH